MTNTEINYEIKTERLLLRPLQDEDVPKMFAILQKYPDTLSYLQEFSLLKYNKLNRVSRNNKQDMHQHLSGFHKQLYLQQTKKLLHLD